MKKMQGFQARKRTKEKKKERKKCKLWIVGCGR